MLRKVLQKIDLNNGFNNQYLIQTTRGAFLQKAPFFI